LTTGLNRSTFRDGVNTRRGRGMGKRRFFAAAICAAAIAGVSASGALAGEVKGPPGSVDTIQEGGNPNKTGALDHANSACAASGLNDFDVPEAGQNVSQVQTAADSWKYYGLPKGAPGTLGLCRGGTGGE
jgi:hypothetical protein